MVTHINGNDVKLRKFTNKYFGIKEYDAKLQEIYLVPSIDSIELPFADVSSDSSDEELYFDGPKITTNKDNNSSSVHPSDNTETDSDNETGDIETDGDLSDTPNLEQDNRPNRIQLRDRGKINKPQRYGQWKT